MLARDRPPLCLRSPPLPFPRWTRHPRPSSCHRQVSPQGPQGVSPALLPLPGLQGTRPGAWGRIQTLRPHCRAQGGLLVISNDWFSEQDTGGLKQAGQRPRSRGGLRGKLDLAVWSRAPGYLHLLPRDGISPVSIAAQGRAGPLLEYEQTLAQRG